MATSRRRCFERALPNHFLNSLDPCDLANLVPLIQERFCEGGTYLSSGSAMIYFPTTLVTCLRLRSHRTSVSLIGREGLIGWQEIIFADQTDYEVQVLLEGGSVLCIPVEEMRKACYRSPRLMMQLLQFLRAYTLQLSCSVRTSSRATLKERVSAWLLMILDRIDGNFLHITHEALAVHLGVRRASITDSLHSLEGEHSLRCARGVINVRDRLQLEHTAGNAYRTSVTPFPILTPDTRDIPTAKCIDKNRTSVLSNARHLADR